MKKSYLLAALTSLGVYSSAKADTIKINEFVVDPQQDHNSDGSITPSDEFFELYNNSNKTINLNN
ncbi:hypothetical protein HY450_02725 [Candidatus Pacearchaeota archaeon]|nr:hypothetical protein [Candidatus Pacearchaeota archaeon]